MAFTPTRISELTLINPLPNDQLVLARGSGTAGRTYRIFVRDLIGNSFNPIDSPTIDFSFDTSTLLLSADVVNNSITDLKLRDSLKLSVVGRASNTVGDPADIAAAKNGQVLRVNDAGTILGFGPVNLQNFNSVTGVLPISAGGSGANDKTNLVPVGAIMPMATPIAPIGWLFCDGSVIPAVGGAASFQSRPVSHLQDLRNLLKYTYDPSGVSNYGKLPDLRGMFVRGWDDGRGVDTGRGFASHQLDAFQGHKHGLYDPGHFHVLTDPGHFHVLTDPGQFYVLTDPGHFHTITDPGHDHGVTQTAHKHEVTRLITGGTYTLGPGLEPFEEEPDRNNRIELTKGTGKYTDDASANITINTDYIGIPKTGTPQGTVEMTGFTATGNPQGTVEYGNTLVQNPTADSSNAGSGTGASGGTAPRTADETRPENVALYYCIKY